MNHHVEIPNIVTVTREDGRQQGFYTSGGRKRVIITKKEDLEPIYDWLQESMDRGDKIIMMDVGQPSIPGKIAFVEYKDWLSDLLNLRQRLSGRSKYKFEYYHWCGGGPVYGKADFWCSLRILRSNE